MHIAVVEGGVSFAHNLSHIPSESFLIHNHPTYELYYFLSGHARFLVNGVEYALEPHTMLLFPPNVLHGIRVYDAQPYNRFTVHFTPECFSLERRATLARALPRAEKTGDFPCLLKNMDGTGLYELLMQMENCAAQSEAVQKAVVPLLTEAMTATVLLASSPAEHTATEHTQITSAQENIINYLNEHFTQPITLDSLSEKFFISKHHLNRSFRKATGTTVRDYLITKRVTYVQQLLINGVPATQAATLAGFGDYTAFYRAYVKRFGHAPSADRSTTHTNPPSLSAVLQEQLVVTEDAYRTKLTEDT